MESNIDIKRILFLDIETVPEQSKFDELSSDWQALWDKKAKNLAKYHPDEAEDHLYKRAGIYAEFGKIVCISAGFCFQEDDALKLRIKSFFHNDEKELLGEFGKMLNDHFYKRYQYLCAHNGQEFDFPYICRRTLINKLPLPKGLQIMGNKPWDNKHLMDTMKLWAFGDYKSFTSLEVMAKSFGIPTPKDDISGADVYRVYYEENNIERIVEYCQKDVHTLVNLFCSLTANPHIDKTQIEIIQ